MTEYSMEIGNLTCRFGDRVLIDHLEDIVIPAFTDKGLARSYSDTSYFFIDVELVDLGRINGESYKGIAGRIVKNTKLVREQIYDRNDGLKKNKKSIRSAPSSFYVLILNQHRLLFMKEMAGAPSMQAFKATLLNFMLKKHMALINRLHEQVRIRERGVPWGEKTKKKALIEANPRPVLTIVPLSSGDSINAFIDRYKTIKSIEFFFGDRNHELDDGKFYKAMQRKQERLGDAQLKFSDKEGLSKSEVKKEVSAATDGGNQEVRIVGIDKAGDKLIGNNDDFKVKKSVDALVGGVKDAAQNLFSGFKDLVEEKIVKNPKTPSAVRDVLRRLENG